jgi:hypothetical protein
LYIARHMTCTLLAALLQWQRNVWRVCGHVVGPACLLAKGAEVCVNELIDQVDAAQRQGAAAATARPAAIAAAVVVPVVVVGERLSWPSCSCVIISAGCSTCTAGVAADVLVL